MNRVKFPGGPRLESVISKPNENGICCAIERNGDYMSKNWLVIVNRVEARIFRQRDMSPLHKLSNSLGREKNRAFTTDRPSIGRGRLAAPASTHNMTDGKNPHDDAAIDFARRIVRFLEMKMNAGTFDHLQIAVEPRMMGWMKRQMSRRLLERCDWVGKDLGHLSAHQLKTFLKLAETKVRVDGFAAGI